MVEAIFFQAIVLIALVWWLIKAIGSRESSDGASGIGKIMFIGLSILGLFVVIVMKIIAIIVY